MNSIAGIISFKNLPQNYKELDVFKKNFLIRGKEFQSMNLPQNYGKLFSTSYIKKQNIFEYKNFIIVFSGRLDNKTEIKQLLKIDINESVLDSKLALLAFINIGEKSFNAFCGSFSFVIFNTKNREIYCVRDHLGMKPIYFAYENDLFCFATNPEYIFQLSNKKKLINEKKLTDIITREDNHSKSTLFLGIDRVERGSFIKINNGEILNHRYHKFSTPEYINFDDEKDYLTLFEETFKNVIYEQISGFDRFGTALSGGLDSTSVSRVAAALNIRKQSKSQIFSYSYKFTELNADDFEHTDEMKYVDDAIAMGGLIPRNVFIKRGNYINDLIRSQSKFPSPCFQGNRYQELLLIEACRKDDIRMILTGFDGDCTVSYGMELIQILFDQGKIFEGIALNKKVRERKQMPNNFLKLIYSYLFLKSLSPILHLTINRIRGLDKMCNGFVSDDIKHTSSLERIKLERQYMYDTKNGHRDLLNSNHFQNSFESLDIDYAPNGIEERHPFCDKRLMELCLNIPPQLKLKDGFTRYIMRESLKDYLPNSVRYRLTKSDLSPYFFYSAKNEIKNLISRLLDTNSKISQYLNRQKLKKLFTSSDILTKEDTTWIINLVIIDEWLIENNF
tara:strand:- start:26306 stop:28162 length:1857 start_codon:yes stop_codon:yes gene_type:complete